MANKLIQFIDGPNLNLLGEREPEIYGRKTLEDIHNGVISHIKNKNLEIDVNFFQSNEEGDIVNRIQQSRISCAGLIINAGGFSHTSVAILDALLTLEIPKIEIHLSNLFRREEFRHHSYISKGVNGIICGFGANSYVLAVEGMVKLI
jgi:3-dehydroquinate dehydratase-2